ncbi:MAG: hypothetical protein IIC30_01720 [Chloroflexi bacterium]|nr:hypothetical protein [Chloroflexota bacterium]
MNSDGGSEGSAPHNILLNGRANRSSPAQIEVSTARPGRLASPTEAIQAAGEDVTLTANAHPTEVRRTESLGEAPGDATAVLETVPSRIDAGAASTLTRLDLAALESTARSIPLDDRRGEEVSIEIAAAAAAQQHYLLLLLAYDVIISQYRLQITNHLRFFRRSHE